MPASSIDGVGEVGERRGPDRGISKATNGPNGHWRAPAARQEDVEFAGLPIINQSFSEAELRIEAVATMSPRGLGTGRVVRQEVPAAQGDGYWDFVRPSPHITVSVTEATYREDYVVRVSGGLMFKLRLLLEGRITDECGKTQIAAPSAQLFVSRGEEQRYRIPAGVTTKLVVLHCHPSVLTERIGLDVVRIPAPLCSLFAGVPDISLTQPISLSSELLNTGLSIISSRLAMPTEIRAACIDALAVDMLCHVVAELTDRARLRESSLTLTRREIAAVYEARDVLAHCFVKPPSISALARKVGLSQTKLKAAFKAVTGATVYAYVIERRMERACELLVAGANSVSEVAYGVGYEFPANFSSAFRRYTGASPKAWRRR